MQSETGHSHTLIKDTQCPEPAKRVLIIDDDSLARGLLRIVFESEGYQCAEAENGAVGLSVLEGTPCDLVITDNAMPVLAGLDFLVRVMNKFKEKAPPVIVVTGNLNQEVERKAFQSGARAVFAKPYDLHRLRSTATNLLMGNPSGLA